MTIRGTNITQGAAKHSSRVRADWHQVGRLWTMLGVVEHEPHVAGDEPAVVGVTQNVPVVASTRSRARSTRGSAHPYRRI